MPCFEFHCTAVHTLFKKVYGHESLGAHFSSDEDFLDTLTTNSKNSGNYLTCTDYVSAQTARGEMGKAYGEENVHTVYGMFSIIFLLQLLILECSQCKLQYGVLCSVSGSVRGRHNAWKWTCQV
jgi:hypothetical protein